ncbi:MAG: carboxypeptidase M32, partial [Lachnospiraceae bacterium]|nr:carboxypeptidase M32 [Lachnospiraceae bacterium]
MMNQTVFEQFKAYYREMESYSYAAQKIHWDLETCAPEKAAKKAIENYTFFRTKVFQMSTAPEYAAMLEKLNSPGLYETLDEAWQYTVRRRKQTYDNFIRIPPEFYAKTVKDRAEAGRVWQEAKRTNNYSLFAPYLKREIENAKEKAAYTNPGEDAYNVLISEGEPGMTCEIIDKVFNEVREGLKTLLPKILSCEEPDNSLFVKKYDPDHVRAACRFLLEYIGFDFKAGSMAEVEHPLTAGFGRNDVRVSNHYYDDTAIDPMFSIIHEGGHGLFNQGVDEKY